MKYSFLLCLLMATLLCVGQKTAFDARMGEVVVKGKIGNVNPPAQLWIKIGEERASDSVTIRNGMFEYRKKTVLPAYGFIRVNYRPVGKGNGPFSNMTLMSVFFEEGTMTVNSPGDSLSTKETMVEGSKLQERYVSYLKKEGEIVKAQKALAAELDKASPEQLQSEKYIAAYENRIESLNRKLDKLIESEIKRFPDSYHSYMAYWGYRQLRVPNEKLSRSVAALFGESYREIILEKLDRTYKLKELVARLSKGNVAPEFFQNDLTGKQVKLSDFKGKYVLIDFWASWCKPCREANPDLVKLYRQFKGPKFEILGVSLDQDADKWKAAVEKDQLTWLHVSDLKGWKNEVAQQYGIRAIPQNLLLDPSGKVVARNLKIDELEDQLSNLLK